LAVTVTGEALTAGDNFVGLFCELDTDVVIVEVGVAPSSFAAEAFIAPGDSIFVVDGVGPLGDSVGAGTGRASLSGLLGESGRGDLAGGRGELLLVMTLDVGLGFSWGATLSATLSEGLEEQSGDDLESADSSGDETGAPC